MSREIRRPPGMRHLAAAMWLALMVVGRHAGADPGKALNQAAVNELAAACVIGRERTTGLTAIRGVGETPVRYRARIEGYLRSLADAHLALRVLSSAPSPADGSPDNRARWSGVVKAANQLGVQVSGARFEWSRLVRVAVPAIGARPPVVRLGLAMERSRSTLGSILLSLRGLRP